MPSSTVPPEVEISEYVKVYVEHPDEAPDDADVYLSESDDLPPGNLFYYEVSLDELGNKVGKRYVRYDGPLGTGTFDTYRKELEIRPDGPDGEAVKNEIFKQVEDLLEKYKIYVSEADTMQEAEALAPEWADVQQSESGAFYYEKLPGQGAGGSEEREYDTGEYVVDTQFGEILADSVLNDRVGDIPVDDFYEYLSEVDDVELVKDCLQAEMEGPNRKTGKDFIERRAKALGVDLDEFYRETGPDKSTPNDIISLSEQEVSAEDLDLSRHTIVHEGDDENWTQRMVWDRYVEGEWEMPTGMGHPEDIPAGKLTRIFEEILEGHPDALFKVWEEGTWQVRRDIKGHLAEEYGVSVIAESMPGEARFDPTDMPASSPQQWFAAELEAGDMGKGNGGLLNWVPPEWRMELIRDTTVLEKAKMWADEGKLHPRLEEMIDEQLLELEPPEPEDYDLDKDVFNNLYGAEWPEYDTITTGIGTGITDLSEVYEQTSTEDLEKYLKFCEESGLKARANTVRGMLWYREDSDIDTDDLWEFQNTIDEYDIYGPEMDEVKREAETVLRNDNLDPAVGAQVAGYINKFKIQEPRSDESWAGQAQSNGRTMAIDAPHNLERTVAHEMGHAFHYVMGVDSSGYGTIDNRDVSSRSNWKFGASLNDDVNESAKKFFGDIQEEWEKYVNQEPDAHEIRSYQRRHGVELMAVGFGQWSTDPQKVRTRHPGLAAIFDEHAGQGEVLEPMNLGEIEEGMTLEAEKNGEKTVIEITNIREGGDGRVWYEYNKETGGGGEVAHTALVPLREVEPLDIEEGQEYTITQYDNRKETETIQIGEVMSNGFWIQDEEGNDIDVWDTSELRERLYDPDVEVDEIQPSEIDVGEQYESEDYGEVEIVGEPKQVSVSDGGTWMVDVDTGDFVDSVRVDELREVER